MFPWPKYGGSGDWGGLAGALAWYARILGWFAGGVADFIRDMHPAQKWVLAGVFAAMCLVVWDALTFQWLLSLSRH
jgi:hypothetical protein